MKKDFRLTGYLLTPITALFGYIIIATKALVGRKDAFNRKSACCNYMGVAISQDERFVKAVRSQTVNKLFGGNGLSGKHIRNTK